MMSDIELRQDILDELEFEPSINAADIGVAVENGVVTLSGHVVSYAENLAAEEAVRRVKSVRGIAQEIEVRYPDGNPPLDDEIAKQALSKLRWDTSVPSDKIQLTVRNGLVMLTGEVDWQFERKAAEDAHPKTFRYQGGGKQHNAPPANPNRGRQEENRRCVEAPC